MCRCRFGAQPSGRHHLSRTQQRGSDQWRLRGGGPSHCREGARRGSKETQLLLPPMESIATPGVTRSDSFKRQRHNVETMRRQRRARRPAAVQRHLEVNPSPKTFPAEKHKTNPEARRSCEELRGALEPLMTSLQRVGGSWQRASQPTWCTGWASIADALMYSGHVGCPNGCVAKEAERKKEMNE